MFKKNLSFPLLPSKCYVRLFIMANVKYFYEQSKYSFGMEHSVCETFQHNPQLILVSNMTY